MPSYRPFCSYKDRKYPRRKPWLARVKVDWVEEFLGYYITREEAESAEGEFRVTVNR